MLSFLRRLQLLQRAADVLVAPPVALVEDELVVHLHGHVLEVLAHDLHGLRKVSLSLYIYIYI